MMMFHVVEGPELLDAALLERVRDDVRRERAVCERILKRAKFRLFAANAQGATEAELSDLRDSLDEAQGDFDAATFDVERYLYPTRVWLGDASDAGGG